MDAVGPGVTAFDPGDAVFGLVRTPDPGNAYAEYAAAPAADVVETPDGLDHVEAASLPMVALTARRALFEVGDLRAGQRVLVHAAAGGVGHVAVQLATHAGAHVAGTASRRNERYLRDLGVDEFVDYRTREVKNVSMFDGDSGGIVYLVGDDGKLWAGNMMSGELSNGNVFGVPAYVLNDFFDYQFG